MRIKNYDPNVDYVHYWKIKLQDWDYSAEIEVHCGGNVRGAETLISALEGYAYKHDSVILTREDGDTLEVEFFDDGEDEIKRLVVGAELVRIEPESWEKKAVEETAVARD